MIPVFFENAHPRLYILLMYMYIPSSNLLLFMAGINWIHDVSFYETEHTILIANFKKVILQICDFLRYSTTSKCHNLLQSPNYDILKDTLFHRYLSYFCTYISYILNKMYTRYYMCFTDRVKKLAYLTFTRWYYSNYPIMSAE